jgi:DNA-directed RNA polymerase alpha subunit
VAENKPESSFLTLLSAPARSALEHAGITTLTELSQHREREILALHGVGPKSLPVLRQALQDAGMSFAEPVKKQK